MELQSVAASNEFRNTSHLLVQLCRIQSETSNSSMVKHSCVTQGVGPIQARGVGGCMDFYLNLLNISMLRVGVGTSPSFIILYIIAPSSYNPFPQILDPFLNHYDIKIYKQ